MEKEEEVADLNRGQIDSSRESVNLYRLPNGVRLTPFEEFYTRGHHRGFANNLVRFYQIFFL